MDNLGMRTRVGQFVWSKRARLTLFMAWPRVGDQRGPASDDTTAWFAWTSRPHLTDRSHEDDLGRDNFLPMFSTSLCSELKFCRYSFKSLTNERRTFIRWGNVLFSSSKQTGRSAGRRRRRSPIGHPCCYQFPQERIQFSNRRSFSLQG